MSKEEMLKTVTGMESKLKEIISDIEILKRGFVGLPEEKYDRFELSEYISSADVQAYWLQDDIENIRVFLSIN